jgi:hypothetical protein
MQSGMKRREGAKETLFFGKMPRKIAAANASHRK